jgi:hypothetical protein
MKIGNFSLHIALWMIFFYFVLSNFQYSIFNYGAIGAVLLHNHFRLFDFIPDLFPVGIRQFHAPHGYLACPARFALEYDGAQAP